MDWQDKTYKQAIEQLRNRLEKEVYEGLVESRKAFLEGKSVEEATSWIAEFGETSFYFKACVEYISLTTTVRPLVSKGNS